MTVSGGTPGYTWSVTSDALPTGVTFGTNGAFGGTPTQSGPFPNITIQVTDSVGGTASQTYTLIINPPPAVTPIVLPQGEATASYAAQQLAASGGTSAGYTWSLSAGSCQPA